MLVIIILFVSLHNILQTRMPLRRNGTDAQRKARGESFVREPVSLSDKVIRWSLNDYTI